MASGKDPAPTVPTKFPDTTPVFPSGDYSYTVELVGSIQRQLGMLTQAVATLTTESTELRKKVERLSQLAFAASVVGTILLVILGFAANKIADAVIATMKSASH